MADWRERYLARYYDRANGWVDGTTLFHQLCLAKCPAGGRFLEVGAGPSNRTSRLLAGIGEVHGIDPDPDVENNDALATATVLSGEEYPYEDASFDACVSDYVLEHVADPEAHLREVRRVLKPGAPYVFRTPNLWHYAYLISRAAPQSVHVRLANRARALSEEAHDPYPTVYAMNTAGAVGRVAATAGFEVEILDRKEFEPSYGMASRALFVPFMWYERAVNSTDRLAFLRSTIQAVLRVPESGYSPPDARHAADQPA
jgi:SAM-dependent methyltransferase